MIKLEIPSKKDQPLNILCLGAHGDDIEIGCGGTILKLLSEKQAVNVYWVVLGARGLRGKEARKSANQFLHGAQRKKIVVKGFKDSFFPYVGGEIKEYFERLKKDVSPEVIFTHFRQDLHQDHRLVSELTWNTFRDHLILEYEIIKYDGDLSAPNLFSHLSDKIAREKVKNILNLFKTQEDRGWFSEDSFLSILRLRGLESNAPDKFAEAFYCRKIIL